MDFRSYITEGFYDELFEADGKPRDGAALLVDRIEALPGGDLIRRQRAAEAAMMNMGITFAVYGDERGAEKIIPFDIIPRIIEAHDWKPIESGLKQRIEAINMFLDDVYHDQKILRDKVIPGEVIYSASSFRKQCQGLNPPEGIWCHITGTDLVRDRDGQFYVLEDNMRCPSGVSYLLENR